MKTGFLMRGLLAFAFTVLLFPLITSGETSPFTLHVVSLKNRVPAGDLVPVSVTFTIAPNHHIYKDQVKIESGDPARFNVASTELPPGKIRYDQFLEKEVEDYIGQVQVKSFLQVSKDIPADSYDVKLNVHYQGCSDKICFVPRMEEFTLPVQVELAQSSISKTTETKRKSIKCESITDLIQLMTLISLERNLQYARGFVEGQYSLSSSLIDLKEKYKIGDCIVLQSTKAWYGVWDDSVSIKSQENDKWVAMPIGCIEVEFPKIEFRNGELGIRKGEVYATERTEVCVEGRTYCFTNGEWKSVY